MKYLNQGGERLTHWKNYKALLKEIKSKKGNTTGVHRLGDYEDDRTIQGDLQIQQEFYSKSQ